MEDKMKAAYLTLVFSILFVLTACNYSPVISSPHKTLIEGAESGDVEAQFLLANAYDNGAGFLNSSRNAKKWYLKAANNGHTEAQNSIGSIYQAEKKYEDAMVWYKKAATQQHALAINNMAYLYDLGLGVPQDRQKGYELYMESAQLGWAAAMFNIANMYGAGQLGKVDLHQAYVWCTRSNEYAAPGDHAVKTRSTQCLEYLKTQLNSEQISQARNEANEWTPNKKDIFPSVTK